MKSIHKTKDRSNLSNSNHLQYQSKRSYYFHPDEDFREDSDWKSEDGDSPKIQSPTKNPKQFLKT